MSGAGRIRIFSLGLWSLREEIARLSGLTPVRFGHAEAVAGWGHKPTAARARRHAAARGIPYVAFEDGFVRSVEPGQTMRPAALVMDRSGIYYDARQPSDLETLIAASEFAPGELDLAREAMAALRAQRVSKYNHAADLAPKGLPSDYALIVDQTAGDESIPGGLADARTFADMIGAVRAGGRPVVVKTHPETLRGAKGGYLTRDALPEGCFITEAINPYAMIDGAAEVHVVSSQFGFEAVLAGKPTVTHGMPFYAGWGLCEERMASPRRGRRRSAEEVFAAAYLRYSHYFDLWTRRPTDIMTAIDQIVFLRDRYLGNRRPVFAFGITPWKRAPVKALLKGPAPSVSFGGTAQTALAKAKAAGGVGLSWGASANAAAARARAEGVPLISLEDGFLRSAGLGAGFVPSLSFTLDRQGIYYDGNRPSDLETLLETADVPPGMLVRAKRLREMIVATGLTKYNTGAAGGAALPRDGFILVAGQVADDEAIRLAAPASYLALPLGEGGANLALLLAARERDREGFLVYKPHPDVLRAGRHGHIPKRNLTGLADAVLTDVPIVDLFSRATRVEVISSLTGFEALLRGVPVRVHGAPFYAGWGLTDDLQSFARRSRRRTLDELVAICLILYPRYLDPVSGLECPVEVVVERLAKAKAEPKTWTRRLTMAAGLAAARARHAWRKRRPGA